MRTKEWALVVLALWFANSAQAADRATGELPKTPESAGPAQTEGTTAGAEVRRDTDVRKGAPVQLTPEERERLVRCTRRTVPAPPECGEQPPTPAAR